MYFSICLLVSVETFSKTVAYLAYNNNFLNGLRSTGYDPGVPAIFSFVSIGYLNLLLAFASTYCFRQFALQKC